jgi:hypothetical protein
MKIQKILYSCVICFISFVVEASGTVDFVSNDLGLNPANLPFAKSLADYRGAVMMYSEETNSLTGLKIDWYQIDALSAREKEAVRKQVQYGFADGKLVAVQISKMEFSLDAEKTVKTKKALDGLLADFRKLDGSGLVRHDKDLQISYEGLCTTMENIAARITIVLPNVAATQDKSTGSISTASVTSSGKTSD